MSARNVRIGLAIVAVFVLTTTIGTTSVFATHDRGVDDFEWHIWSRSADDGHLSYLNCDDKNDYCALKIKTMGSIQGMSQTTINSEVDAVERHFDSLGKKMSIDRVTSANSYITAYDLRGDTPGETIYDLHCTSWHPVFW